MPLKSLEKPFGDSTSGWKRDKSLNTPEFNKKAKKRRAKAKHDAKGKKKR